MSMHDAAQVGITNPDSSLGWAVFGQTSIALLIVVAVILLIGYGLRKVTNGTALSRRHIKVVGSAMVGTKERVVIIEVKDRWLVLGVGNGNVTKLDKLPKPDDEPAENVVNGPALTGTFRQRFAQALKRNIAP